MSALKKVIRYQLLVVSLLLINFFIFTSSVLAADFKPLDSTNYNDSISTQRFYRNQIITLHTILLGTDPTGGPVYGEKLGYVTENGQTKIAAVPGLTTGTTDQGAIGMLGSTIAALYNPPTSSVEYLANFGENIGLSPRVANAQSVTGSGANVISPVLKLWQVVRNISYTAFILVFMAAGLMIMFRQKLNPQTVIGLQQALPGLIIGLVLITFSYFISALIVDLTFVGTRLVAEIFASTELANYYGCDHDIAVLSDCKFDETRIRDTSVKSDAFGMYGHAATRVNNISDVFGQVWGTLSPKQWFKINFDSASLLKGVVLGPIGIIWDLFGQATGAGVTATLASVLIPIILAIALMIQFIRLIIALLMSYIQILIMVIAGPLFILISAIPGRGGVLSYWFKSLLANALVFPAVFAGFLFAGMLLQWDSSSFHGNPMPLFGGLSGDIIKSLLAFGVLLGLPSIPEMVRNAFGVKGPQGFTQAALGGFMGGFNLGRGGLQLGFNQGMERTGIRQEQQARQKQIIDTNAGNWNAAGNRVAGGAPGWIGRLRDAAIRHG